MLGQVLDERYHIIGELGRGGIGIVYRAQQRLVHDRDVAVKILNRAASTRVSTAHRFETEARIISGLRHPNTIKLIDTGHTQDGRLYIVTECLDGEPLSERLSRGPMSALDAVHVIQQIAEALTEAHEKGVVHRDLKPANVFLEMVGSQQIVKVLDFGIAKLVDADSLTAPMQIFGTPGFMAPEQCRGETVDGRADLYALGVLGYLCLTGDLPLDGPNVQAVLSVTIEAQPTPLTEHLPNVDPELEGLIMQLLAKAPGDRLPDAGAVRDACAQIARALARTDAVALPGQARAGGSLKVHNAGALALTPPTPVDDGGGGDPTEINPASLMATDDEDSPGDTQPVPQKAIQDAIMAMEDFGADDLDCAPTLLQTKLTGDNADSAPEPEKKKGSAGRNLLIAAISAVVTAGIAMLVLSLLRG